jgi:hypothetical protein
MLRNRKDAFDLQQMKIILKWTNFIADAIERSNQY